LTTGGGGSIFYCQTIEWSVTLTIKSSPMNPDVKEALDEEKKAQDAKKEK
jgi:hypothetical protein